MTNDEAVKVLETYDMSDDNEDTEFKEAVEAAIDSLESRQMPESEMREMLQDIVTAQSLINRTVSRLNRFLFSEVKKNDE